MNFPGIWGGKDKIMITENTKIIHLYISKWYKWLDGEIKKNIAKDKMSEYADDLLHHIIQDVYKMDEEKAVDMVERDKLRWYMLKGAGMQLRSSTSPFYGLYRKNKLQSRENFTNSNADGHDSFSGMGILEKVYEPYEHDELYECFQREFENLHWYQKTLMTKYWIEGWNLTTLYKHYNISKVHLIKDLNKAMNTIRTKCEHC